MIQLSDYKNIHCIGVGGIGLSAIAAILLSRGYSVSGSDMKPSDITQSLESQGATIYIGHRRENVEDADLIIYSAAIAEENPEIQRAREKGIPLAGRAQVLGTLMSEYPCGIAISGTHGKTTTTSMVSLILEQANLDPTILVGGNMPEFHGNVKTGKGRFFVTEACEYRDSFLELYPDVEVILNIDSDHLDYFKDLEHIVQSFRRFSENIRPGGKLIAYEANPFVTKALSQVEGILTFGYGSDCTYRITNAQFGEDGMPTFDITFGGENMGRVKLHVPGEHNILNAAAAFACCHTLGVAPQSIIASLEGFAGTGRRFDVTGITAKGVKVVDDYAHHPTEIRATLSAASNLPHQRLWCLFQPHTYTRTLALFDEFAEAFRDADVLVLADIYAAREKDIYQIDSGKLAAQIQKVHPEKEVHYLRSFEEIADFVTANAQDGDLVITMGAGDIYKVGTMLMDR